MKSAHQLALWSGVCALLGNLVGLKLLEIASSEDWLQLGIGVLFSMLVGLLAYAKERLNEVKREEERHDVGPRVTSLQEDFDRDYQGPRVPGRPPPPP